MARKCSSTGCWRSASPLRQPPSSAGLTAVVAAAGSGARLGAGGPKAFVTVAGRPLVDWSITALRASSSVGPIVVACPPGRGDELSREGLEVVEGGATRALSVSNALAVVDTELVAIHDAARPLVSAELVDGVVAGLVADPDADGAIAATPVTDTIKQVVGRVAGGAPEDAGEPEDAGSQRTPPSGRVMDSPSHAVADPSLVIETTVDRGRLWAAQTPQVFRVDALRAALAALPERAAYGAGQVTDEAMLLEAAGGRVLIHPAPPENLKVTTPLDLRLAELLLTERSGAQ